jgi:uncharacterized membrane protein YbjE (DUF340 family)
MEALTSLLTIFLFLGLGMLLARFRLVPSWARIDLAVNIALRGLLFFMGVRIGLLNIDAAEVRNIGLLSIGYAVVTVLGTAAAILLVQYFLRVPLTGAAGSAGSAGNALEKALDDPEAAVSTPTIRKVLLVVMEPVKLFLYVLFGFAAALFIPFFSQVPDVIGTWLLYMLLFFIGIQLIMSEVDIITMVRSPGMVLLPLVTAAGSITAGLLAAPFFGLSPGAGAALSAGFGWYSLSGVIISDMGNPVLGSAGFLINLIRETIALFTIPLLGKFGLHGMAIGVGGATSMDVTLPLVERSCGDRYVPLAIAHGAILSLLVPFLVPLFFGMA